METDQCGQSADEPASDWSMLRWHAADALAADGSSLTPLREKLLRVLWSATTPLGAYELADRLNQLDGGRTSVNSVYRLLGAYQKIGLVRRIESRHAFVLIAPSDAHCDVFLLCTVCNRMAAVESADVAALLEVCALGLGFKPTRQMIEVAGQCGSCSVDAATPQPAPAPEAPPAPPDVHREARKPRATIAGLRRPSPSTP